MTKRWTAIICLQAVIITVLVIGIGIACPRVALASCPGPSLYSSIAGDASAKTDWFFAGVAGQLSNGYAGRIYISVFDTDASNVVHHVDLFEYQETSSPTVQMIIFSTALELASNRSDTVLFNGVPPHPQLTVPSGKVHFHIFSATPINVYAEQWLDCQ